MVRQKKTCEDRSPEAAESCSPAPHTQRAHGLLNAALHESAPGEAAGAAAGASHSKLPPLPSAPAGNARNKVRQK